MPQNNNPIKPNYFRDLNNFTSQQMQSEMHQQFQSPLIKKQAVTRAKRLEQFLWHEFYEEYIRSQERLCAMSTEKPATEYSDEYCCPAPHPQLIEKEKEIENAGEMLTRKYPLYSNAAITLWNPNGELACTFGKSLSITLPTSQQNGQFG